MTGATEATATTDSSGSFSFDSLLSGTYTVKPVWVGYSFSPSVQTITIDDAGAVGVDFTSSGNELSLLAGAIGQPGDDDGTGTSAQFTHPAGVALDSSGNLFVADWARHVIRKISPAGDVTTFAGKAGTSGTTDANGTSARFNRPVRIAIDSDDNLFVSDNYNHTIRKITPAGDVTTVAGTAGTAGSADGTGTAARFNIPAGIAIDGSNNLYVADWSNHTIRKITPAGVVTTVAGTAGTAGSADGTGTAAQFNNPGGIVFDGTNFFITDFGNLTIRKMTPSGLVTTFAGSAGAEGTSDGIGSAARFNSLWGLALDGSGNIYVGDNSATLRVITPAAQVTTLLGVASQDDLLFGALPTTFGVAQDVAVNTSTNTLYLIMTDDCVVAQLPL